MKKTTIIILAIIVVLAAAASAALLINAANSTQTTTTMGTTSTTTTTTTTTARPTTTTTTTTTNTTQNNPVEDDPTEDISALIEFADMWSASDNYRMDITIVDWGYRAIEEYDGNLIRIYSPMLLPLEMYYETVGENIYEYVNDYNNPTQWTKSQLGEGYSTSSIPDYTIEAFLSNVNNFVKVEGEENKYTLKDGAEIPYCNNIVITLDETSCTVETNAYYFYGYTDIIVVISDFGGVELTLPTIEENTYSADISALIEFADMWRECDNYQMDITLVDWTPGGHTVTEKRDGNLFYQSYVMWPVEHYVETVDGKQYVYQSDMNFPNDPTKPWTKFELGEGTEYSLVPDYTVEAFLSNVNNFVKVEGEENKYVLKDGAEIPYCTDVVITLDETSCTIELNAYYYTSYTDIIVVISNFGGVELTLPAIIE